MMRWCNTYEIKIIKYIAPKVMTVNGYQSPCECTYSITCAYCVQASLLFLKENIKASDEKISDAISIIRKNGIRKTARELNVDHSTVRRWIKLRKIPQWALEKLCRGG